MSSCLGFNTKLMLRVTFLIIAVTANGAAQAAAPDLSEATLEQLGEIEVYTASKHLQLSGDAPSSVMVVSADDIQQHGYRTLADVLRGARGFFVSYDRMYSSLGVRGFARPGDYNTRVLLLVDGHRLNDNIYDEAMIGTEFPMDIDLIDRIEIIRGPSSSLYGSNALFAVINVITKKGQDLNGLELSASAASFNGYSGRISYGAKLNRFELLVSGTFSGMRGQNALYFPEFDSPGTNNGISSHLDDDQTSSFLTTISYRNFRFQTAYGTRDKGISTGAFETKFNYPGSRTIDSHGYFDLRYEHSFEKSWSVLARTFYDRYTYKGIYMYGDGEAAVNPNRDDSDGIWWGTELELSKVFGRHHFIAGGEYRNNLRQDQLNYDINPFVLNLDDRRTSHIAAGFLQDEIAITKSVTLNAGFRYDYYSGQESSFDPRAALVFRPWSKTVLKAVYGQAFRVPNAYEMFYSDGGYLPNPDLKPERIRSTEVIWEQGFSSRIRLSTSVFYNSINGFISQYQVSDGFMFQNLPRTSSTGAEGELNVQVFRDTAANISYSFQQTKESPTDEFLDDSSPRQQAKFSVTQSVFNRRLFVSVDGQYRSAMQAFTGDRVPPYPVLNLTVFSRKLGNHLDLSASVYNLLDRVYSDPGSGASIQSRIQQDGRTTRVKLTCHWGQR
jgi:outer membrane receptor protein involved in Fe transport